jgi:hypothetical protein
MMLFEVVSMFGCYCGIMMIAFGSSEENTNSTGSSYSLVIGFLATLFGALGISISSITIYEMKELHYSVIQFWQGVANIAFFSIYWLVELYINSRYPL